MITIARANLHAAFAAVLLFVGKSSDRNYKVRFSIVDGQLEIVATDGHTLAVLRPKHAPDIGLEWPSNYAVNVSPDRLKSVTRDLKPKRVDKEMDVLVYLEADRLQVSYVGSCGPVSLGEESGRFPNFRAVMPSRLGETVRACAFDPALYERVGKGGRVFSDALRPKMIMHMGEENGPILFEIDEDDRGAAQFLLMPVAL